MKDFYKRLELRFLTNLNAGKVHLPILFLHVCLKKTQTYKPLLVPWDAHMIQLEAPPNASYIGKPLKDLQWREKYGINVVYIKRGENLIHVPDRHQFILPFDQVGIVATDSQIAVFKPVFDQPDLKDQVTVKMSTLVKLSSINL